MKTIKHLLLFAFAITVLISCGRNEGKNALAEMEKIVEKAEKNKDSYTQGEWKQLAASFEEYEKIANEAVESGKLGFADRIKLVGITARWAALAGPATLLEDMMSKINEALQTEEATTDSDEQAAGEKRWVVSYKNIVLGDQDNNTNGHFLKLKTGETVKVDEAVGQEEYLAMLIYTDDYLHISFPANAEEESLFGKFNETRLYIQEPGGIEHWAPEKTTGGMFKKTGKINAADFNKLAQSNDPAVFDQTFRECNGDSDNISYGKKSEKTAKTGEIYLVQFNNMVRGIMLLKSVKEGKGASVAFDLIVEGREEYNDVDMARYLQPDEPLDTETADAGEIKGRITECKTGKAIGGVTIQFEDRNSEKIQTVVSNNAGEFSFVPDPAIRELEARGKKTDYMSRVVNIGSADLERYKKKGDLLEICMEKVDYDKALRLDNIHYDTGKADIRPDARPDLDRLVQFLNDNPEVRVELSSHTDSRSAADYNLKLSQQRADEAKKYIVSKGIAANRIVSVGYGETRLLNRCADGVECSEEEHQLNRRTEIKMIREK